MGIETTKALAAITDAGLFEHLALSVLQCAEPLAASLSQQGVNAGGKTIASPVDNVGFVRGAVPPHMIVVHHTIAATRDLRGKWLSGLAQDSSHSRAAREGDIAKTVRIVRGERARQPGLAATLLLTTNQEPDEKLVRDVAAASAELGIAIDIWSRVRLARVLDTDPTGQWLRASLLGIEQQWLSPNLFAELSRESLAEHVRPYASDLWVPRALDRELAVSRRTATFLIGTSGAGKSVACLRAMALQLNGGGYALVLPHGVVETAPSLNVALLAALQRFRPALSGHVLPLSLCSAERPLLLLVEDINHAGNPAAILDKITRWSTDATKDGSAGSWQILCPMWQRTLSAAPDALRRTVEKQALVPAPLTLWEAGVALEAKARVAGATLSEIEAHALATALGHDPLLIGLVELGTGSAPDDIIAGFVEHALQRCEAASGLPASELRVGLRDLAEHMLARGVVSPSWGEVASWGLSPVSLSSLRVIAAQGELLWLIGPSIGQSLAFRHDRVRDHLLREAAIALFDTNRLDEVLVANPYFSEVIAGVLIARLSASELRTQVLLTNPTALFQAVRIELLHGHPVEDLVALAEAWLSDPGNRGPDNRNLRHHIAALLYECDGPDIARLASMLPESTRHARLARLRNGDIKAGIEDCRARSFYSFDVWRKRQIDHARSRHGATMLNELAALLEDPATPGEIRSALLNLAGDFGEPGLASAIAASWRHDAGRAARLNDYLWASAYCCTEVNAADLLAPVCDAWAELPAQRKDGMASPRDDLVGDSMRWGFERHPPVGALGYLALRGRSEVLDWQLYYLMHGIDHPVAIAFCIDRMAAAHAKEVGWYSVNFRRGVDVWERRRREQGDTMSDVCRTLLLGWWQDVTESEHRRVAAFDLWSASWAGDDVQQLRAFADDALLADRVLRRQLERNDATVIPKLVARLDGDRAAYWWHFTRHVSSPAVTAVLEQELARIAADGDGESDSNIGWEVANALVRLPRTVVEPILLRHAAALSRSPRFVQTALYFATPGLLAFAARAMAAAPKPAEMLKHLTMHFGVHETGHPGVQRPEQIRGLQPYLGLLDASDLGWIAEACNKAGWFDLRRELFDPLIPQSRECWTSERLPALFDELAGDKDFIPLRIDEVIEAGVRWAEVASALEVWLSARNDLQALGLAGEILEDRGHRRDLSALLRWAGPESDASRAIVANATFEVCLRNA